MSEKSIEILYYSAMVMLFHRLTRSFHSQYVPPHTPVSEPQMLLFEQFLAQARKLFVLTGAGVSTESGIRDYRSQNVGLYATSNHRPTNSAEFLRSAHVRRRYWARNTIAWPVFKNFTPNISHHFLADFEQKENLHWLVTQNVDRLHHKAGSKRVTELHGSMYTVSCLSCQHSQTRDELQSHILAINADWNATSQGLAPDADVFVSDEAVASFHTPTCLKCGGDLKPDVVFFGDSVPQSRVDYVNSRLVEADSCLVIGTSLFTFSALRHVKRASDLQMTIFIINIGPTRADSLQHVIRIQARCGEAFEMLGQTHST